MAKANPKAWHTSPIAKITYRSVGNWDEFNAQFRPYFPTWKEAHDWMLARAEARMKRAQTELKRATSHLAKVKAMKEPNSMETA